VFNLNYTSTNLGYKLVERLHLEVREQKKSFVYPWPRLMHCHDVRMHTTSTNLLFCFALLNFPSVNILDLQFSNIPAIVNEFFFIILLQSFTTNNMIHLKMARRGRNMLW
jgi:hypothetical protein